MSMEQTVTKRTHQYWTPSEVDFIRANIETLTNDQIATHLGRPKASVVTYIGKVLGLNRSDAAKALCRKASWAGERRLKWTPEDVQYLKDNIQTSTMREIALHLGKTWTSVKSKANKDLGLKKTNESFRNSVRRADVKSRFKKGNLPHNTVFGDDLKVTIRHHKNGPSYKWIRIGFKQWKQYHFYVWEQANGPIPPDHLVIFRNNDQMDVRIENLELVTRKDFALRNSGGINLSDSFVAYTLAPRDKEKRHELLTNYPKLIELKRYQLHLNRLIENGKITRNTTRRSATSDEGQNLSV